MTVKRTTKRKPLTSNELFALCQKRWALPAWVLLNEVRNQTGYNKQERYADALALSMYPGRGIELIGCEFKSTRSDVVRELADPEKAQAIQQYCDRWYLVVGRKDLVSLDEIPETWGLMVPQRGVLKIVLPAPKLDPEEWPRTFIASLLRNASRNNPQDAALKKAEAEGFKRGKEWGNYVAQQNATDLEKLQAICAKFEEAAGVKLHGYTGEYGAEQAGIAFKLAKELGVDRQLQHARRVADRLEQAVKTLREAVKVHTKQDLDGRTTREDS